MRSKTSCFNMHLARHMTLRYWPLWALYALVIFVMGPVTLLGQLNDLHRYSSELYIHRQLAENAALLGMVFNAIAASCAALAVFSPLYKTDSAVMEAALPVDRRTRFITSAVTGLSWLLITDVLMFLIMLALEVGFGHVYMPALWLWLGVMLMQNVAFYGMACFGAMLTGKLIVGAGIIVFMHFAAGMMYVMLYSVLDVMLWGYAGGDTATTIMIALSPIVQLFNYNVRFYTPNGTAWDFSDTLPISKAVLGYEGWGYLMACVIVGVIFAAVAYSLYIRRQTETAGETISVKILRPVFIAAATLYCAMGIGIILHSLIFTNGFEDGSGAACAAMGGCMLVGAFIGYVLGMMILKRTVKVQSSLKGFAIPASAVALFAILCATGLFGWSTWVPRADNVEYVDVHVGSYNNTLYGEEDVARMINIHHELLRQYDEDYDGINYRYITLSYKLENGHTAQRYFKLPDWENEDDAAYLLQEMLNDSRLVLDREIRGEPVSHPENYGYIHIDLYTLDDSYEIFNAAFTADQAMRLLNEGIIADIKMGCGIGKANFEKYALTGYPTEYVEKYGVTVEIAQNAYTAPTPEEIDAIAAAGTPVELNENIHISLELCYYMDADDRDWVYFVLDDSCVNTLHLLREMGYIK